MEEVTNSSERTDDSASANKPPHFSGKKKPNAGHKDQSKHPGKKRLVSLKPGSQPVPKVRSKSPIPRELMQKYSRGKGLGGQKLKDGIEKKKLLRRETRFKWAEKQAARAEILLTEDPGFLIPEKGELTTRISQSSLKKAVDITSAAKCFELNLSFGPYRLDYTRNGRYLLLGGRQGHIAAFDWITKRLMCEINVMESVFDVQWLHVETMFAVAQKEWVYIYDNVGVELHCIKILNRVLRMTFLPYHFLLATANEDGWLGWLDISIGQLINKKNTHKGRISVMKQNPYNAVLCTGQANGVVSMWSPNCNKPLASILCHKTGVQAITIDKTGKYMVTSSADKQMKIWDIRTLSGPVHTYYLRGSPSDMSFSQRDLLALSINNTVEIFKNCHLTTVKDAYLRHRTRHSISNLNFCPYEDYLGLATNSGFTSMLVPGAGEPNYDAFESNPMQTKSQRKESEVKALLEKIQPEMITLDPTKIGEVDVPTLKDRIEAKTKLLLLKPQNIDYTTRKNKRIGSAKAAKTKKIVKETRKKEFLKEYKGAREKLMKDEGLVDEGIKEEKRSVLDRFRPKK